MQDQAHHEPSQLPDIRQPGETAATHNRSLPYNQPVGDKVDRLLGTLTSQYAFAIAISAAISLFGLLLQGLIGYQAVALVDLLAVVMLALFVSRGPILLGTALTALGWNFLCAPPLFSFHMSSFYDRMMLVTYFAVALTVGQLTARLRALREAEIKTKLLVESEKLSRTLLNSVSHELRTPLSGIAGAASGLRASGTLTPTQEKLATEIESASARLNRVVQSLLSAARLKSGQIRPKLDWCDIADLVQVSLHEASSLTGNHPLALKVSPRLPLVKMDFVLTQQALTNLIVNAAVHTPAATPIEVIARIEEPNLILQVADRGQGLPEDQLKFIFELFYRAPAAKPGGTGLGLAIVKGFVEAQGGRVDAANREDGGAIFTIAIPAVDRPNLPDEMP